MTVLDFISNPVSSIHGTIHVPGDKSISHRALILGAIATGTTRVDGFLSGEDCLATLDALRDMGVRIDEDRKTSSVAIYGLGKNGLQHPKKIIDCKNSGTSMRLLSGLLCAQNFDTRLVGDSSLSNRPMLRISQPLEQMGADISTTDGKAPLIICGKRSLKGISYLLPEASAQVKSCLLLAGMYAEGQTKITETGTSRNHMELMLKAFSYPVEQEGRSIVIQGGGQCIATQIKIPGDFSSAAFFIVAATIIPGSSVLIKDVGVNPTRTGLISILKQMGANITLLNERLYGEEAVADIQVKSAALKGISIPSSMVPLAIDEFPIIFIAAACAKGETTLHGAKELRLKESDRIGAMIQGLQQLGIEDQGFADGVHIKGGSIQGGVVDSRGDHRIAMSFAVAGAIAPRTILIRNCAQVATSFPDFVATANQLHLQIEDVSDNE